jgi:hypothetical protein
VTTEFWQQVERQRDHWLWRGDLGDRGQPLVPYEGHRVSAARVAWLLAIGLVPDGHLILPDCGERLCVRPAHLMAGTPAEYAEEAIAWGWWQPARGVKNGAAKLTAEAVEMLRRRRRLGERTSALAREVGMSRSTVARMLTGRTWRQTG